MSLTVKYIVECEDCGRRVSFTGLPQNLNPVSVRSRAHGRGWTTSSKDGKVVDRCPTCDKENQEGPQFYASEIVPKPKQGGMHGPRA